MASDIVQTAPPEQRGRLTLLELLVVVGITCLLISILLPLLNQMRQRWADRDVGRCTSNLNRLGMSLALYVQDKDGVLPPTLEPLVGSDVHPEMLVCPFGDETPAQGDTPEQVRRAFAAGGHMSYVYVGVGVRFVHPSSVSDVIIAYDRPENHQPHGGYALFADGRIDYLAPQVFQYVVDEVAAGRVPVDSSRWRAPKPTTAATTVPTR